ncbi:MAG: putative DNA binding domain-containing protein [Gammaproteobacteria bacterium]|nr:putative DNA binding domain-containing protein [Gammaproteobacteria bacterium]
MKMTVSDAEIRQRLRLGEDSTWEFKQLEFSGNRLKSPKREDLADELIAFANASGGKLLCGITDDGHIQGISPEQAAEVDRLLVETSRDAVKPPLRIDVYHREIDKRIFVFVEVPRGDAVHERDGRAFVRVGATKQRLDGDERFRLAQNRAQSRYLWFDKQLVANTGIQTLDERLWEPLLSVAGADDPQRGLMNLRLLGLDEAGVVRATVAGVLLCTQMPQQWFPQASIMATHYRGQERASGQLDAQEIAGPLPRQIGDAVRFVVRNMRVAARKVPEREDMPEYSTAAVFEAVVNAVVHRDYSMSSRRIRLSMFNGCLEIDSPGQLPNGMSIEGMETSQATRNEVLASVFGRIPVGDMPGSTLQRFLMERRGDGVSIIKSETMESSGNQPQYRIIDRCSLVLDIPAAKLELSPASCLVTVHSRGEPLAGVEVLVLFPNKTWQQAATDEAGAATLDLYTTHLPMTVYAAAPGYKGGVKREWVPGQGGLRMELDQQLQGGSVIFEEGSGQIPGLHGRLNPMLDTLKRTCLYADNIAIEDGRQQPVSFRLGKPIKLTDEQGLELSIIVTEIIGNSALVDYRPAC